MTMNTDSPSDVESHSTTTPSRRRGWRSRRSERGAVLVEAALSIPILLLVILGSVEFGFAWEAKSATASGVRTGVLRAASIGDQPETDMRILQSVVGEIGTDNVGQVDWIMVFNATGVTDKQGRIDSCGAAAGGGGIYDQCVVYPTSVLTDIATTADPAGYQAANFDDGGNVNRDASGDPISYTCAGVLDSNWCAARRTFDGDVELGIAVKYRHEWFTGILPFTPPVFEDHSISSTFLGSGSSISPSTVTVSAGTTTAYVSGFTAGSTPTGFTNGVAETPPSGAAPVLGVFANHESTTLNLTGLDPFHSQICVTFKLHIIGDWESTIADPTAGDEWELDIDGTQAYFNNDLDDIPPAGAVEDTLGYTTSEANEQDYIVPISQCIAHTGTTASIDFIGRLTANAANEGWAITDVLVTTS